MVLDRLETTKKVNSVFSRWLVEGDRGGGGFGWLIQYSAQNLNNNQEESH